MKKILIIILLSVFCYLSSGISLNAQTLEEAEAQYLAADYTQATETLEKILALHVDQKSPPKLYYLLGLSYLKDGNLLRSSDCFDIIIKEYPDSEFIQEAMIKSIDIDLMKGDYQRALDSCDTFLKKYPQPQILSAVLFRQYKAQTKLGNWQAANATFSRLQSSFPNCPELKATEERQETKQFFGVQVGSFKDKINAQNLVNSLKDKGFDSYIADSLDAGSLAFYRVRVGHLTSREAARDLEKKLSELGFPTKIFP